MSNEVEIVIGPEIVKTWARLDYTVWYAIAEMVDNSLQAYFNNKKELDAVFNKEGDSLKVDITLQNGTFLLRKQHCRPILLQYESIGYTQPFYQNEKRFLF